MKTLMIAALTLDGKIAKAAGHNVDWTSKADKQFFRSETLKAGCVIFGSSTFKAMGVPMPKRLNIVLTRNPKKFADKLIKNELEFTNNSPQKILENLESRGFKTVVIGGGSKIYSLFLKQGLIDKVYLTIAGKIFGKGVPLFDNVDINDVEAKLISLSNLGKNEILLKYVLGDN